jgi:acyl-CoA thioesterase
VSAFAAATAVTREGDGVYAACCDTAWSAPNGPNGGYLAAIVVRALEAEAADPGRALRSLTCHFLRPPADGPLRLDVELLRSGRTVTSARASVRQDDRLCVEALAAFTAAAESPVAWEPPMPAVPRPEEVEPWPLVDGVPPIAHRLACRHCVGPPPFTGSDEPTSGGWLALRDGLDRLDAAALALFADAWLPAAFHRMTRPAAAPTLDLTVHFRRAAPAPGEQVLGVFRSVASAEGLFEEDGELWSEGGVLLAQSRQLALLR